MVGGGSISMEREEWWWVLIWLRWLRVKRVMVTSEASYGYERRLRAKRVMVTSEASYGRVQWHSYGGRFWSVLPHPAHFVIPVISLLWRKVLECSSSHCSLRHPCVLTLMEEGSGVFFLTAHFVIHVSSLTSSSLWSHSLRHPCVLTPITCLLTHLIVIPDFSLESSHPSHPWLLTLTSLVLPLIPYSVFSHTPTLIALTKSSHRHPWLLTPITCATMLTHPRVLSHLTSLSAHTHHLSSHTHHLTSSVTTRTLTSFSLVSPHWVISHHLCSERVSVPTSMVSYYHQVYSHTVFSLTHSPIHVIPVNTSMVSYYHQVYPLTVLRELVLPLTLPWCRTTTKSTHSLLWENLAPTHTPMVSYYHQVITHTHTNPCAPTHFISPPSRYKCITNHLPHSPTHHASITSSSPHHLFLSPITTNRFLSLHTTLLTPPFHSQPSQSSPKSSPISIHTHNDNSRTP